jgi:acyl transferase domain-containing protein/NADP-dependent 3-hydroxy acid dehydrogenase YdfG
MTESDVLIPGAQLMASDAVAIVGVACRLPKALSSSAFWDLLRNGVDAVTEVPVRRLHAKVQGISDGEVSYGSGRRLGGFLDEVDRFDPGFFGISPREATLMDPQQRLMLELCWEALEDAGIPPDRVKGSSTGVFAGAIWDDYAALLRRVGSAAHSQQAVTGQHRSILANRVSYTLGLRGPSMTIDTAQSSSLVAVHLACESLRRDESVLALAGGVNLDLVPGDAVDVAKFGGLSPDGRCFTFDARANGYVRGEGGAVVVLKPLSHALADGDTIYCVVRGSAMNNDGGGEGLTAPNSAAQEEVIRLACRRAGVDAGDVQYVELHGTGTRAGDPVEATALGAALGVGRPAGGPLLVGSVKTNIGHLEGAAGVVGLIKTVLAIRHRELPPSINFETPNPRIPFDELRLRVQDMMTAWPRPDEPLIAGVSSFGMGGTNCHVVLSDWQPAYPSIEARARRPTGRLPVAVPVQVSGKSAEAVRAQAQRLHAFLQADRNAQLVDIAYSLATTRSAFTSRAVVLARDRVDLLTGLDALSRAEVTSNVVQGTAHVGRTAFLFAGQGSQRPGMGRELYDLFPVFSEALDAACAHLDRGLDRPLREVLFAPEGTADADRLYRTVFTQPALFAFEVALYRLLEHWGVRPDFLLGHSIGELAAAHVAGVLSLADACTLVVARGGLMQMLPTGGAMVSLRVSEDEVLGSLADFGGRVGIAAVNGPISTVISGDEDAVLEVARSWRGRKSSRLRVSHAFHSPRMDGMLEELADVARRLTFRRPLVPIVSNLTGRQVTTEEVCSPEYWVRHVRECVRFRDGVRRLQEDGATDLLDVGPDGSLAALSRECLRTGPDTAEVVSVAAVRSDRPEAEAVMTALARLHVHGVALDWEAFFAVHDARRVALPTYAFQRQSYWIQASVPDDVDRVDAGADTLPRRLAGLPDDEQDRVVLDLVLAQVAAVLGRGTKENVEPGRTYRELGLDSLASVELSERLARATGLLLPATAVFDHPTPAAFARYLRVEALGLPTELPDHVSSASSDEPVAVVAMSCRFPGGVRSPEDLWRLVSDGVDAISEFPSDRGWDRERLYDPDADRPGTTYVRSGGFLDRAGDFDAEFFGISPREASAMDPQQRLLLETSWEAIERARLDPTVLRGDQVGVFVGVTAQDYGPRMHEPVEGLDGYLLTGNTTSVASGRIAYALGLEGPAVTVDTACSSSLVAVHLASQALRQGECTLALAGGATVMGGPGMFVEFSRQRGLARDGRCKPFSADADGTAWAEGVGMLLLERLSDARRSGHPVLAIVRGSAINQDGASNGLSAPNGPSQQRLIRKALAGAGLSASDVDAVEAHGTGTPLGDPIEAQALLATYGQGRQAGAPLLLGSLKSNIGHTQAASGVAGVIKMIMAMMHAELPGIPHLREPSPHVDWMGGAVALPTETTGWPSRGRPRRAGVSAFGISGTNAHVILEQAPPAHESRELGEPPTEVAPDRAPVPLVVSGRNPAALRAQADRLARLLAADDTLDPVDVGYSLLRTRPTFGHTAVVLAHSRADALHGLTALAGDKPATNLIPPGSTGRGATAFVFPGQGSQWVGMAVDLLDTSEVFAARVQACEQELARHVDWSLTEVLRGDRGAPPLTRVDVVQPTLFAVMVSLAELWRSLGVEPGAVVGHSQGEIAAACVAGALSLGDATKVVALRSRALTELAGSGGMVSVPLSAERLTDRLATWGGRIGIAAVNGPASTVVSGDSDALEAFLTRCVADGIQARGIPVDYASHSPHVESIRGGLLDALSDITPRTARVKFYSTITGGPLSDTAGLDAEYWYRNLRETVRFEQAVRALSDDGYRLFIETSPHPVLKIGTQETLDACGTDGTAIGTLRRDHGDRAQFVASLAEAVTHGAALDADALFAPYGARTVALPTYAFQHRRYWLTPKAATAQAVDLGLDAIDHPLLGALASAPDGTTLLTGRLSLESRPWLADHAVAGTVVLPGTAFLEMALRAGDIAGCEHLDELMLEAPLILPDVGDLDVRVAVAAADPAGRHAVTIHSRPRTQAAEPDADERTWTRHATGVLTAPAAQEPPRPDPGLEQWPPSGAVALEGADTYRTLDGLGYGYGPCFQGLRAVWRAGSNLYAEVRLPDEPGELRHDGTTFGIHPALLDAALHPLLLELTEEGASPPSDHRAATPRIPFSFTDVRLYATGATVLRVRLSTVADGTTVLMVADAVGAPVMSIGTLTLRELPADRLAPTDTAPRESMFDLRWAALPVPTAPVPVAAGLVYAIIGTGLGPDDADRSRTHASLADLDAYIATGGPVPDLVFAPVPTAIPTAVPTSVPAGPALADDVAAGAHESARWALDLVRQWLAADRPAGSKLVVVTRGAVAAQPGDHLHGLPAAPVWGLLRTAQSEHPGRFALIDLDDPGRSGPALRASAALGEPQLALRGGIPYAPHVVKTTSPTARHGQRRHLSPRGTALITGGTGTLGGLIARRLVAEYGIRHLLLVSRGGRDAAGALEADLTALGARVTFAACDVAEREPLRAVIEGIPAQHPLTVVVHAAGVLDDGTLQSLTPDRLDAVLRPKIDAAWHLHELTRDTELDAFVLFSSVTAVTGNAGQGAYTAANAFLDALAEHRRAAGLPANALAWGLWAEGSGMTRHLDHTDLARMSRGGIAALSTQVGLALFDAGLDRDLPYAISARLDRKALRALASTGIVASVLRGLVRAPMRRAADAAGVEDAPSWTRRMAELPEDQRPRAMFELVRAQMAAVLGHGEPECIDVDRAFRELGFDSLTALELRNRLNAVTGLCLPATVVFDHPSATALVAWMTREVVGDRVLVGTTRTAFDGSAAARSGNESIAIVGMSCRYPGGVGSPEDLWRLVSGGCDVVGAFPGDRGWDVENLYDPDPSALGKVYTRHGGFLYESGEFDAEFFGISPREASAMDPQQRLLLETSWEAFEHAGIDPKSLRGSSTGVFAGVMYNDYASRLHRPPDGFEGLLLAGSVGSVVSGRVSYVLGLEGPAVSIDTACSSSLVALHWACQALRSGECDLALAGGVTVMSTPNVFIEFSRQRGLSVDGRCKSFAAAADGTGWGEGVGLLLVERLSDAVRNGHPVLALVRGSAVSQDGASNGLTAPNGPSQERVIRQALANARLSAGDVDVVEAHGTGTTLGDPIEAQALLATYGQGRPAERPLWLGSIKSNLGHTQAAAGVAGVIKMVMAMRHGVLPRTLHVDEPSPHVDWSAGRVELLAERMAWPEVGRVRRAGVSAFGISGTNAHVIVEQAPAADELAVPDAGVPVVGVGGVVPWVLSARSAEGLRAQTARLREWVVEHPDADPVDVGWTLAAGRAVFDHRAVVWGRDTEELVAGLGQLAPGGKPVVGLPMVSGSGPVFVFPGQGSQWVGMAAELLASCPVFAESVGECAAVMDPLLADWSLTDALSDESSAPLERVDVVQPVLFAVMVGLARWWESCGVHPDAVIGHSQGEIAAAHIAGFLSLQDAARVVVLRSRVLRGASGGGMVSVGLSAEHARELIAESETGVSLAAVNGPASVVLSGSTEALAAMVAMCERDGVRARWIPVDYASHSAQMDVVRDELQRLLADVAPRAGQVPMYSTLTGKLVTDPSVLDGSYWCENLRRTVELRSAVSSAVADGHVVFLECSPHPGLVVPIADTLDGLNTDSGTVLETLRRGDGGPDRLMAALSAAFVAGVPVDWTGLLKGDHVERVQLPTYAFQRRRYWLHETPRPGDPAGLGLASVGHPVLGASVDLAGGTATVFTGRLSLASHTWLADHVVLGSVIVSGTVFVDLVLRVGAEVGAAVVQELTLHTPLVMPESVGVRVQVTIDAPDDTGARAVSIHSRPEDAPVEEPWTRHATGTLTGDTAVDEGGPDLTTWPPSGARPIEVNGFYERLAVSGVDYGPVFQRLQAVWRRDAELFAEVELAEEARPDADRFDLHPALLDAAIHALGAEERPTDSPGETRIAFSWRGVRLFTSGPTRLRVWLTPTGDDTVAMRMADQTGQPVASIESLTIRPISTDQLRPTGGPHRDSLFRVHWKPVPVSRDESRRLVLLGTEDVPGLNIADRYASLAALGDVAAAGGPLPDAVVLCAVDPDLAAPNLERHMGSAAVDVLSYVESWLSDERLGSARLVVVTRRAVAVDGDDGVRDLVYAPVWGLVRATQAECPGRVVLVDVDQDPTSPAALVMAIAAGEPQVAVRGGRVLAPTLARVASVDRPAHGQPPTEPAGDGTVLITGADGRFAASAGEALMRRLAALPEDERERELVGLVRTQAAAVLGHAGIEEIGPERAFKEVGFDSLTAVELRNRLMRGTGVRLLSTLVFDFPTPASLARHLSHLLADASSAATPVLADLDRLQAVLLSVRSEDGARDRIAERLRELLLLCDATDDEPVPDAEASVEDLQSATDDELFSLVDQGFE